MLELIKPSKDFSKKYIEMYQEWNKDGSFLCPDILEIECNTEEEYHNLLNIIDNTSKGIHNDKEWYEKGYYYFIIDNDRLIGAIAIRKNLTPLGYNIWGNIAIGIRPSERKKGYARNTILQAIQKCKDLGINEIIGCHYIENKISERLFNSINAEFLNIVKSEYSGKEIKRYRIK